MAGNYFKSYYPPGLGYSPTWYGTMDWAPKATVLLYDDEQGQCIGFMDSALPPEVTPMTEQEAGKEVADCDGKKEKVWKGDKLKRKWDEVEESGLQILGRQRGRLVR